jgi:hypothetical protein
MARTEALIISEEIFKSLAPVSGSLDWEYVWPHILATQDAWVQPIIGQSLYEKIMSDIVASSLTGAYKTLVEDYIARTTVWFTCFKGLPFWGVKVVNSGVIQRVTDDGATVSFSDIDKLSGLCKQQAEFYKQRLIDYLCANPSLFPEYNQNASGEMSHDSTNYSSGLNLEPTRSKKWYL